MSTRKTGSDNLSAAGPAALATFQAAVAHHQAGRLSQAEALYRQVIQQVPNHSDALHLMGLIACHTGRVEEGTTLIRKAVDADPNVGIYPKNLANALRAQGKSDEALAWYLKAEALMPGAADIQVSLANLLQAQGKMDEALVRFQKAASLDPDNPGLHFSLAYAFQIQGRLEDAASRLRKALALKPDFAEACNNLGVILKDLGHVEEAMDSFRRAVSIKPDYVAAHNNLGNALRETGSAGEAEPHFRQALALDPRYAEAHNNLGNVLKDLKRLEEAEACFRRALQLHPAHVAAWINLGNLLMETGRNDDALACFRRATDLEPRHAVASHMIASITGATPDSASGEYVEKLFDDYARNFETSLVNELEYGTPAILNGLIIGCLKPAGDQQWDVLDLGCGTGLSGIEIAPHARQLVGVDLSANMLAKAKERNLYHRLEKSDLLSMMKKEASDSYDIVIAADVFVYVGKLDEIMAEAKRLLRPSMALTFSVEAVEALPENEAAKEDIPDYKLTSTGRYAHSFGYIERIAGELGFGIRHSSLEKIRLNKGRPVQGWCVLLQKP